MTEQDLVLDFSSLIDPVKSMSPLSLGSISWGGWQALSFG